MNARQRRGERRMARRLGGTYVLLRGRRGSTQEVKVLRVMADACTYRPRLIVRQEYDFGRQYLDADVSLAQVVAIQKRGVR